MSEPASVDEVVALQVNGSDVSLTTDGSSSATLLDGLRSQLGLRGVRSGCTMGSCGSCTIIVDGRPDRSCQIPIDASGGSHITTPEGLGTPGHLHPVQQAFVEAGAAQCGFCINGMIMTVAALAAQGPTDEVTLRSALDEHICRCGTHARILRAARTVLGLPAADDDGSELREISITEPDAWHASLEAVLQDDVAERLSLRSDGCIEVRAGKVEIGQGIGQAMRRIAARYLGIDEGLLTFAPVSTSDSPDEGFTSGSFSVDTAGVAMAASARAFRRLLLERAAQMAGTPVGELRLDRDAVVRGGRGVEITLAHLAGEGPLVGSLIDDDRPDWQEDEHLAVPAGPITSRFDLPEKLSGAAAFLHDMVLPGMLHARTLLPPTYEATLSEVDLESVRGMPGIVTVLRSGRLLLVVAESEQQAVRGRARLMRSVRWDDPGLQAGPAGAKETAPESFRALPSEPFVRHRPSAGLPPTFEVHATYRQPYQAHAQISPSCAVAQHLDGVTEVWQHGQGVFPVRSELAALFGTSTDEVIVHHVAGPGAYGQTLADDAAAFAALAARELPGRPIRFQFTTDEEFSWEPYGSAVLVDLAASLDDAGRIGAWSHRTLTDVHSTRARGSGHGLIVSWLRDGQRDPWPGAHEGGVRNAVPLYDIPELAVSGDFVRGPLRTSALRTLGSFQNVFATESFMDEMAERAGRDPLEFRLAHLGHRPRVRRVLESAAAEIGWEAHVGPSGRGIGIAVAQYKDVKAIVAQAAEVTVDHETGAIDVVRIVTVCDAGEVIDLDGLVNQIEGGTLQGLSRTMNERVVFSDRGIGSRDWLDYPVLRFDQTPRLRTIILHAPGTRPLGVGEASMPPTPAAIANAIDDAIGVRIRDLPITTAGLQQRLMDLEGDDLHRVRIGN